MINSRMTARQSLLVAWLDNSGYGMGIGDNSCHGKALSTISISYPEKPICRYKKRGDKAKLTTTTSTTSGNLSQSALNNLEETESEIETSSQYFKPKPDKTYVIRIDPQNKIERVETDRFKDAQGKSVTRYQIRVAHVNNGKEQFWDTSKTVCTEIIRELKKGLTVLKVTRHGSDRSTTYTIEGVR